MNVDTLVEK